MKMKQHYVPRFIIKGWENLNGKKLLVFDKEQDKQYYSNSRDVFSQKNYHEYEKVKDNKYSKKRIWSIN